MDKKLKNRILKGLFVAAVMGLSASIPVYAWFNRHREIARMQEVVPPESIYLSAANREGEINFQVGGVDVKSKYTEDDYYGHKDYVFSVSGEYINEYTLQLAHTTNNPFTYKIYEAELLTYVDAEDDNKVKPLTTPPANMTEGVDYVKYRASGDKTEGAPSDIDPDLVGGVTYYYAIKTKTVPGEDGAPPTEELVEVDGRYLNQNDNTKLAEANGVYHDDTYDLNTDTVQKNAEPLYWQKTGIEGGTANQRQFCHDYILRVEWNPNTIDSTNKETDLIYLYVKATS